MRRWLPVLTLLVAWAGSVQANGILIPDDKKLPPLAMVHHKVTIQIEDQVAATNVDQVFRNHTERELEATYVFPVPKGASVNKFSMTVNGKEVHGELIKADEASKIYTSIVQRTQDPGLLEYMGNNLIRLRVFPIPPRGDQKVTLSYTSVANKEGDMVEYIYPLKTDGKATRTLEEFAIKATIKSQHVIQSVYSPTHSITLNRNGDKEASVTFDRNQGLLDKDFQLFYSLNDKDIGLTALMHKPLSNENGYVMLLISPRVELAKDQHIPRDMVFVIDISGSMAGDKMEQAKKALKYCLSNLHPKDRFGIVSFSNNVNRYRDDLLESSREQIDHAKKWVDNLKASGGTAISPALMNALDMRSKDESRSYTMVFFTDGLPTLGETVPEKILKNVAAKNTANTRIFTFGVGDDVDAAMLDQLAEQTRAVSTYVRPAEDIEVKVSALHGKISHPILSNLKLKLGANVGLEEVYPPQLPDLFHGGQLVVLARYNGNGPVAITLTGQVGKETKEFSYELTFPSKSDEDKSFVEHLWARRKVGYLLDLIRVNGEKKELMDDLIALSKKYGIATPYTSYLIVPDGPLPVANKPRSDGKPDVRFHTGGGIGGFGGGMGGTPPALTGPKPGGAPTKVADFARDNQKKPGDLGENRGKYEDEQLTKGSKGDKDDAGSKAAGDAKEKKEAFDRARDAFAKRYKEQVQQGKLGVDLAVESCNLRNQCRLTQTALRQVNGRQCMEFGGVWIDEGFDPQMKVVTVKAMSAAYFRILEKQPKMKDVYRLGNFILWVAPNGAALVIDQNDGVDKLSDKEIDELFTAKKK